MSDVSRTLATAWKLLREPAVDVDLMRRETAANAPFFRDLTTQFYRQATRRHPKFPFVGSMTFGVALCRLPRTFEEYLAGSIESSGRRNVKKAERSGYTFGRFDYNARLREVAAVRTSAEVRQGEMAPEFLEEELKPCSNPVSKTRFHDYPYYGVFRDGRLVAFAGVFVCGQAMLIEQMYGHAELQSDGIVPLLLVRMAREAMEQWPCVEFCVYGTYFGAGVTMRRFKTKFGFIPSRVRWRIGD